MPTNKLTVAIPTYNSEGSISRLLDSIINETDLEIDLLIIDDGSSDSTVSICENYQSKYNFIRLIALEKNMGLDCAYLKCILNCNTDYLWIIGHDDFILKGAMEKVFKKIEDGNDAIYVNFGVYDTLQKAVVNEGWINPLESSLINKSEFIEKVGLAFSFISSMVFKVRSINKKALVEIPSYNWAPTLNAISTTADSKFAIISSSVLMNAGESRERPWNKSGSALFALKELESMIVSSYKEELITTKQFQLLSDSLNIYLRKKIVSAYLSGYKKNSEIDSFIRSRLSSLGYFTGYYIYSLVPVWLLKLLFKIYKYKIINKLYWRIKKH